MLAAVILLLGALSLLRSDLSGQIVAAQAMANSLEAFWGVGPDASGHAPLGLWPQVGLIKLVGPSAWAVGLPQVVACALCVIIAGWVFRLEGTDFRLWSAVALASSPLLATIYAGAAGDVWGLFLLLWAAGAAMRLRSGGAGWLALAMALCALAFNFIGIAALVPLPAITILWFTREQGGRVGPFILSLLLCAGLALAWAGPVMAKGGEAGSKAFLVLCNQFRFSVIDVGRPLYGAFGGTLGWLVPFGATGGLTALLAAMATSGGRQSCQGQLFWLCWAILSYLLLGWAADPSLGHALGLLVPLAGLFAHSAGLLGRASEQSGWAGLWMAAALLAAGLAQTRWLAGQSPNLSWMFVFTMGVAGVGMVAGVLTFLPNASASARRKTGAAGLALLLAGPAVCSLVALASALH